MGRSMTASDTFRRYAAECLAMSQQPENAHKQIMLVDMAAMWLRLAELAEKNEAKDNSPPEV